MPLSRELWEIGLNTIRELEVDIGVLASSRDEIYGCIFGRDSLITCLKLLTVYKKTGDDYFLQTARKILINLIGLQGKTVNPESGEQPGKCIHEFRPQQHEHLTQRAEDPWFVYPDGTMRNYDSIDATPLFLIAVYRYWQASGDQAFLDETLGAVHLAMEWIHTYGDSNHDGFVDYSRPGERKAGGLVVHSWMDSHSSIFHEDGTPVTFPVASIEVQAYTYLALVLWGNHFGGDIGANLLARAEKLKQLFNERFLLPDKTAFACGIDGAGKQMESVRSNMGHCLWASRNHVFDSELECIVDTEHIPSIVQRLMQPDLFVTGVGIRTLSSNSSRFDPKSYHNGSFWPHDISIIREGFEHFGFKREADTVKQALLNSMSQFKTPIELFVFEDNQYSPFTSATQASCMKQAWSAAALLSETTENSEATAAS